MTTYSFAPVANTTKVAGSQRLYTHSYFPGLLLKEVSSVAEARACGGVLWCKTGELDSVYGAVGRDMKMLGPGEYIGRVKSSTDGLPVIRSTLVAASGYPANSIIRYYYSGLMVSSEHEDIPGSGTAAAFDGSKGASDISVMGIVTSAEYGVLHRPAGGTHGYLGKSLYLGSFKKVLADNWKTAMAAPRELESVFETSVQWWIDNNADFAISVPVYTCWEDSGGANISTAFGVPDLANSGVHAGNGPYFDTGVASGQTYPPYLGSVGNYTNLVGVPTDVRPDAFNRIALHHLLDDLEWLRDAYCGMCLAAGVVPEQAALKRPVLPNVSGKSLVSVVDELVRVDLSELSGPSSQYPQQQIAAGPTGTTTSVALPGAAALSDYERIRSVRFLGTVPLVRAAVEEINSHAKSLVS